VAQRFLRPRLLIGLAVFIVVGYFASHGRRPAYFRWHSVPSVRPIEDIPLWMKSSRCLIENDPESREDELAVAVFRTFPDWSAMKNAAFNYFGELRIRKEADAFLKLCPNTAVYDEFAKLSVSGHYWRVGGFPGDHDLAHLRVARNLGPRYPEIVAETGFAAQPIEDRRELSGDIRPLARVILAEFGAAAAPWSVQAFGAMGGGTELEATAAQIAVVTHHPGALEKTAALLNGILHDYPDDPIPDYAWMRFFELAFALAAAGSDARPFIDPVVKMTCRKIDVWAPPFGWVPGPPSEMSRVLEIVGVDRYRSCG
jgi:hypothetical protein